MGLLYPGRSKISLFLGVRKLNFQPQVFYNIGMDWQSQIAHELERAEKSRLAGNEGQARVCARRAAGIAVREYLGRRGLPTRAPSAYALLGLIADLPDTPPDAKQAAVMLTLRVTESFTLPVDADLLEEARRLCRSLLPEFGDQTSQ